MEQCKRFKDPVYGYIYVSSCYTAEVIDTAPFQRLRRIIQTSYSPVYPSAAHNRFVHSLGVYHLGKIACNTLKSEFLSRLEEKKDSAIAKRNLNEENLTRFCKVFLLACLLHDVGHSPFSHTGEKFFLEPDGNAEQLHNMLCDLLGNENGLAGQLKSAALPEAAPHEIMSAIIGLEEYRDLFKNYEEREFFARCITGYSYTKNSSANTVKNCFISLLNSPVIDVDKLDYLIRDAYITGFSNVNIDYVRLLRSITVVGHDDLYEIAYRRGAISVLENVVYAHDAERKWIQNHPVVLYETYILENIIASLNSKFTSHNAQLFSRQSLSCEGHTVKFMNSSEDRESVRDVMIRLLSDDDVVHLIKSVHYSSGKEFKGLCAEYFSRKDRRHPIWKSEAEYKAYWDGVDNLDRIESAMEDLTKYLKTETNEWIINDGLKTKLNREISKLEGPSNIKAETKEEQLRNKRIFLRIVNCLEQYAEEENIKFDFAIISASQFTSGFGKANFSKTKIAFTNCDKTISKDFGRIVTSFDATKREREKFFYLYHTRDIRANPIDISELCRRMSEAVKGD